MNEEGGFPILPAVIAALVLGYFGLEINRRRKKLRAIFNVIDTRESAIAEALEQMVENGELKPFAWGEQV
jgi:hypothetical protein